ncbi:MAG: aldehyde ferredoxin oxidoreductase, partial [Promethearchaeota archaeon]
DDVIRFGIDILRTELAFNERAGITQEMNDISKFFREEASDPINLKFTFELDELKSFWNRLDKHTF